jgi:hypothetical protein
MIKELTYKLPLPGDRDLRLVFLHAYSGYIYRVFSTNIPPLPLTLRRIAGEAAARLARSEPGKAILAHYEAIEQRIPQPPRPPPRKPPAREVGGVEQGCYQGLATRRMERPLSEGGGGPLGADLDPPVARDQSFAAERVELGGVLDTNTAALGVYWSRLVPPLLEGAGCGSWLLLRPRTEPDDSARSYRMRRALSTAIAASQRPKDGRLARNALHTHQPASGLPVDLPHASSQAIRLRALYCMVSWELKWGVRGRTAVASLAGL